MQYSHVELERIYCRQFGHFQKLSYITIDIKAHLISLKIKIYVEEILFGKCHYNKYWTILRVMASFSIIGPHIKVILCQ